jgi:hypothetical protein
VLAIIGVNPIDLLGQGSLDIGVEGIAEVRRGEKPISSDART